MGWQEKSWPCKDLWPRIDHILYILRHADTDVNLMWTNCGLCFYPKGGVDESCTLTLKSQWLSNFPASSFDIVSCHLQIDPPPFFAKALRLTSTAGSYKMPQDTSLHKLGWRLGCATRLGLSVTQKSVNIYEPCNLTHGYNACFCVTGRGEPSNVSWLRCAAQARYLQRMSLR